MRSRVEWVFEHGHSIDLVMPLVWGYLELLTLVSPGQASCVVLSWDTDAFSVSHPERGWDGLLLTNLKLKWPSWPGWFLLAFIMPFTTMAPESL